ncbi:MAG: hypothetical protein U5K73_11100 [Halofilum sp. (in: g-proteobacteria)]|nr:hypothetical protein [Halofilum sp. (in: g-proteobacteria)]
MGNDFAGIAVIGNNDGTAEGTWEFSVDNGSNWDAVGTVSDTNALILAKDAQLRFVPDANANDENFTEDPALDVLAVDDSDPGRSFSSTGDTVRENVSGGGGDSDVGNPASPVQVTAAIAPVNDAPVLDNLAESDAGSPISFEEGVDDAQGTAVALDPDGDGTLATEVELLDKKEDDFASATLVVEDNAGADPNDFFFVRSGENNIGISGGDTITSGQRIFNDGSAINFNGTKVATIVENSVDTDGGAAGRLEIELNANAAATGAAVDAILQNLSFNSDDPATGDGDTQGCPGDVQRR